MDGTTKRWEKDRKSNKSDTHVSKHRKHVTIFAIYSYTVTARPVTGPIATLFYFLMQHLRKLSTTVTVLNDMRESPAAAKAASYS